MKKNVTTVSFWLLHDYETAGAVLGEYSKIGIRISAQTIKLRLANTFHTSH